MKRKYKNPWSFVPTTYFAEGLPYMLVNSLAVIMYKRMGVSNAEIAFWTSWLYLPWVVKMLWGPLVDSYSTKRNWLVNTQFLLTVSIFLCGLSLNLKEFLFPSIFFLLLIAFVSATHDISVDGFYMLSMSEKEQAFFVGIRAFFYRVAMLFTSGALVFWAGKLEEKTGNIPGSWFITLGIAAAIFLTLFLWHKFVLPFPDSDGPAAEKINWRGFSDVFVSYFKRDGIFVMLGFILLYRFGEAMLVKLTAPFLLDEIKNGGLAVSTSQVGVIYGTVGLTFLIIGGIAGGLIIARYGLKKTIWPMALLLNLPDLAYVYMSFHQTLPHSWVYLLVAFEQLGYGLGTTAFMFYLIEISGKKYKTSFFAISTGIMALGMMLPGLVSGYLQETVGYRTFFIIVCFSTLPGMALIPFLDLKEKLEETG